jgi:hypothetical protein
VGKSVPFIFAIVAIGHVCYSFSRLFTSEAAGYRVEVAEACDGQIGRATANRTWRTWYTWKTLRER